MPFEKTSESADYQINQLSGHIDFLDNLFALQELRNALHLLCIRYNLFFVIAIPFLLLTAYSVMMMRRPDPSRTTVLLFNFTTSRYTLYSYIVLYLAWWVIRNVIGI